MISDKVAMKDLIKVSAYAGDRIDLVQAGGGNTSIKTPDKMMHIKASGFKLRDIAGGEGIASVDCRPIMQKGTDSDSRSFQYPTSEQFKCWEQRSVNSNKSMRPSIEVSMHALLGNLVLHTHPVIVAAFLCIEDSKLLIDSIFHGKIEFLYVPYAKPGMELAILLMESLKMIGKKFWARPSVIFLENHGLVVHGNVAEEVITIHENVLNILRNYNEDEFKIHDFELFDPELKIAPDILNAIRAAIPELPYLTCIHVINSTVNRTRNIVGYSGNGLLFPDAAVYCGAGSIELSIKGRDSITTVENEVSQYREAWCQPPRIWKAGDFFICAGKNRSDAQSVAEVWWAHETAALFASRIGSLRYLPLWRVHELQNWEAEIYRKKLSAERAL